MEFSKPKTDVIVPMAMLGCIMIFFSALMILAGQNFIGNTSMVIGGLCIILTLVFIFEMPLNPPINPLKVDAYGS